MCVLLYVWRLDKRSLICFPCSHSVLLEPFEWQINRVGQGWGFIKRINSESLISGGASSFSLPPPSTYTALDALQSSLLVHKVYRTTRHIQIRVLSDECNSWSGVALLSVHLQFSVKQRQQMQTDLIMKKLENRANIMKRDTNYVVSVEDARHWQQSYKSTDSEYVGKLDKKWKLSSILENKRRNMGQKWGQDEKSLKFLQSSGIQRRVGSGLV